MPSVGTRAFAGAIVQDLLYGKKPPAEGAFRRAVRWGDDGSAVIAKTLAEGGPSLVARFGSSELACASFYTRWRRGPIRPAYPAELRRIMRVNAGMFPVDDASLDRFSRVFLDAATEADVLAVWFNRSEDRMVEMCCPSAKLVHLEALNAVIRKDPWTAELAGKTVLVIHPFAETIASQYRQRRHVLFDDPRVLPEFELKTIKAVQSGAGAVCEHASWFDALASMRERIEAEQFDVAIVGAGAYGLPLGAAAKRMGRQAVHMGGATQLLFGIRGRRWEIESPDDVVPLFNEHWVRPSAEETPGKSGDVEGGCYW